jgi:hypothetical protein
MEMFLIAKRASLLSQGVNNIKDTHHLPCLLDQGGSAKHGDQGDRDWQKKF